MCFTQFKLRAFVSKGWGALGVSSVPTECVYMIGACPHDWLFEKCAVVCHHGGAGTTATGLRAGKPTIIVPFFGDQPFWGETVDRMKVGPPPIPFSSLNFATFSDAINYALTPEVQHRAAALGAQLRSEDTISQARKAFERYLPINENGQVMCTTYENQRYLPVIGWTSARPSLTDPLEWSDARGILKRLKEWFNSSTRTLEWTYFNNEKTDDEGWSYSDQIITEKTEWHEKGGSFDFFRRRKWESKYSPSE